MDAHDVSTFRLYLLRATYLFIVLGLGVMIWPGVIHPPADLEHMRGVVRSLLAGISILALIGLRYPLQLLPLLLLELVWKSVWLLAFGIPRWSARTMDAGMQQTWFDCLVTLPLFLVAIPWPYVWTHYVRQPADRWRGAPRATQQKQVA